MRVPIRPLVIAGFIAALACGAPKSSPTPPVASTGSATATVAPPTASAPAASTATTSMAAASAPTVSAPATVVPPAPEPITCKTEDDCWVDEHYAPMRRPKALRGKRPKPCHGTEHTPKCEGGVCAVTAWKC